MRYPYEERDPRSGIATLSHHQGDSACSGRYSCSYSDTLRSLIMNSVSAQALEEAANIATEFIYSALTTSFFLSALIHGKGLDNLPNEVRHMCEEIKYLDSKAFGALPVPPI